jgi:hypothetical protein
LVQPVQLVHVVMAKSWPDSDDSQTEIYLGPPRRPTPLDDLMEIPSLVLAIGSRQSAQLDDRPLLTPVTLALAALCVVAGVTLGSLIGFSGHAKSSAAVTPAAAPVIVMPIAAPPAPIVTPAPPAPTTLRIESTPSGATVMFVADGETTLVGTTPVDTNVDPARAYDVLVTLPNHVTRIEHVEPSSNHHLAVTLEPAP